MERLRIRVCRRTHQSLARALHTYNESCAHARVRTARSERVCAHAYLCVRVCVIALMYARAYAHVFACKCTYHYLKDLYVLIL